MGESNSALSFAKPVHLHPAQFGAKALTGEGTCLRL
jgi:hypothetical protein